MVRTAYIHLWGKRIGAVAWDPDTELGSFEYVPGFEIDKYPNALSGLKSGFRRVKEIMEILHLSPYGPGPIRPLVLTRSRDVGMWNITVQ